MAGEIPLYNHFPTPPDKEGGKMHFSKGKDGYIAIFPRGKMARGKWL